MLVSPTPAVDRVEVEARTVVAHLEPQHAVVGELDHDGVAPSACLAAFCIASRQQK